MRFRIMSDLHLEMRRSSHQVKAIDGLFAMRTDVDALILAGDVVSPGQKCSARVLGPLTSHYKATFFVAGNHEYYGSLPEDVDAKLVEEQRLAYEPNLDQNKFRVLECEVAEFMGRRILGTTLWFPDLPDNVRYAGNLADFSYIRNFVPWVYDRNRAAIELLKRELREGDVVVTHHLPSQKSVHPKYAGSSLNRFFVCDVENLILDRKPALWVHGHTHTSCDYMIGSTRVVCNPLGYPCETGSGFKADLVVEV